MLLNYPQVLYSLLDVIRFNTDPYDSAQKFNCCIAVATLFALFIISINSQDFLPSTVDVDIVVEPDKKHRRTRMPQAAWAHMVHLKKSKFPVQVNPSKCRISSVHIFV